MATRTFLFFMHPEEFWETLHTSTKDMNLFVFHSDWDLTLKTNALSRVPNISKGVVSNRENLPPRLYLSATDLPLCTNTSEEVIPAKNGWIQLDAPTILGKTLFIGDLGIKTDWYEPNTMTVFENHSLVGLFDKVRRRFNRSLKSGLWCTDSMQTWSRHLKHLRYSSRIEKWCEEGGMLRDHNTKHSYLINSPQRA